MRIVLTSVFEAFDYVMDHYYPFGLEEFAERTDTYAVISIQDSHTEGFGIRFARSRSCRDVLTLFFDDITREVEGAVLFDENMAEEIIDFIMKNTDVDTLLIHCYAGQSRSRAVALAAAVITGQTDTSEFETGLPNEHVLDVLDGALKKKGLK